MVLSHGSPCFGDSGHTCPDYPQHEAVLNAGLDALRNAASGRDFGLQPDIRQAGLGWSYGRLSPIGDPATSFLDVARDELKKIQNDAAFAPLSNLDPSMISRVNMGLSSIHAAILAVAGSRDNSFTKFRRVGAGKSVAADASCCVLLGFMGEAGDNFPVRKDMLTNARLAMERLNGCAGSTFSVENLLTLAGLRELTDDHNGAISIYAKLLPVPDGKKKYSNSQLVILDHVLASYARANDLTSLSQYESAVTKAEDVQATNAILETYVAHDRVEDAMRIFRNDRSRTCYSTVATLMIVRNATDQDRSKVVRKLDYARSLTVPIFTELAAKGWNKEALCMCLGSASASETDDPSETVRKLERTVGRIELSPRLITAARLSFSRGFDQFGRGLLSELVDTLFHDKSISAIDEGKFDLKKISELRTAIRSIGGSQIEESLNKLDNKEQIIRKRVEKLECLQLAERLHHTGDGLQRKGLMEEARSQFVSALDIRRKNLESDDVLIANTLLDLARTNAILKLDADADREFQECIDIFRRRSNVSDRYEEALQSYGSFLNRVGNTTKAALIYDESKKVDSTR